MYNIDTNNIRIYKTQAVNMFIGREKELATLERLHASGRFEMPVVYGRRRVGKTRLIGEFINGKRAVYFQARRTNAKANLDMLSLAVSAGVTDGTSGSFDSFDAAFDALARLARKERLVVVIDEFPYLAQADPAISSLLQDKIDHVFKDETQLMLVLCGSSLSFMEEQVLGYQSPLYGRRTAQMKVAPLDFFTMREFLQGMGARDAALMYGVTNGVPAYMEMVDPKKSAADNIRSLFFEPEGYLYEEPGNLLLQECRSPEQYDAIVQAIARGRSRLSEIASLARIPQSNARTYLKKLESIGIVKRELPFGDDAAKRAVYALEDSMFRFWYRFVPANIGLVENEMGAEAWQRIEPEVPEFMGPVFERICAQWIVARAKAGAFPVAPAAMGRWWGNDPRTKSQEEVDIVVSDGAGALALCECKWRNEPCGADVAKKLVDRSELFRADSKKLYLFSKSGFSAGCAEFAAARGDMELVSFADMAGE